VKLAVLAAAAALLAPVLARGAEAGPPVVAISVEREPRPAQLATGFAADPGRVVTVAHVLDGGGAVTVRGADGIARRAVVLRTDARIDLALLAVPGLRAAPARFAGLDVRAARLALPGGAREVRVRRPIWARVRAGSEIYRRPALDLAADVAIGDSGAPLVTLSGRVAGVVFARSRETRTAYAVDGPALGEFLADRRTAGR
jgi:S1-C subfamily serine protease